MRRFRQPLFALLLAELVVTTVAAEEGATTLHPQSAVVTSPGAAVRSGPGDTYYLTDTLPEATEVEVYRRQADGWCAIRPPGDSFSWVFSQNVRLVGDGVAEINKDDVAARVGSRLSAQRDVVQVRLRKGETVAILGRDERDGGLWYKIAPPAGEFRWVQAKDIGLGGTSSGSTTEAKQVTPASHEESIAAPPLATAGVAATAAAADAKTTSDQWTAAKSPPPVVDITPIGAGSASSASSSAELADHLRELELRLSRMVSESPTTWNIAPLEQAAEQLLARADTVADREAVKVTLGKIDRFAAIQRRYASANSAAVGTPAGLPITWIGPAAGAAGAAGTAGAAGDANPAVAAPYDAVGILRPVVSRRPGAPQFALVNAEGQVVTFVTPSPDVNLQPYVGQRIGVTGSRGYIPEFRRAHVTAGRVTPLGERMLR
jgi:uncharacterized protein YgiM (DUF1202 family)